MKAEYKNWVPREMVIGFVAAAVITLVCTIGLGIIGCASGGFWLWLVFALFLVAFLFCGAYAVWCLYAYNAFSYDGKRRLSRQIIEGTGKYLVLPPGGKGLDVGCGSGALTIACARNNPQGSMVGLDYWGREYASFSKALCERNAKAEGVENAAFVQGNAIKLDFDDEVFDAVTSNYVYHNIAGHNKQELVLETLRVLKKGGTFAIHDLMSPRRYGDIQAFAQKLRDMGYERVEVIDTADGMFMTRKESRTMLLGGSTLLVGKK